MLAAAGHILTPNDVQSNRCSGEAAALNFEKISNWVLGILCPKPKSH